MTLTEFRQTLESNAPPQSLSSELTALWYDAKDDWDAAHACVQASTGANAAWVHAYLHRREGDLNNARYWYAIAKRDESSAALEQEWESIAGDLLGAS